MSLGGAVLAGVPVSVVVGCTGRGVGGRGVGEVEVGGQFAEDGALSRTSGRGRVDAANAASAPSLATVRIRRIVLRSTC